MNNFSLQNSFPHSQTNKKHSNNFIAGGKRHLVFNFTSGNMIRYCINQRKDAHFLHYDIMETLCSLVVVHVFLDSPNNFEVRNW